MADKRDPTTGSRRCSKCGTRRPLTEFYRHPLGKAGRAAECKACARRISREFYARNRERILLQKAAYAAQNYDRIAAKRAVYRQDHGEEQAEYQRRHNRRHPDRAAAREATAAAIQAGRLVRGPCAVCGLKPKVVDGRQRIEAHHHHGYSEQHSLDVQWLCRYHHREADKRLRAEEKEKSA